MRIAFAIKEIGPPLNGPERNLTDLIRHLMDLGHEVHLFLHRCRALPDPRVRLHRVPVLPVSSALRVLSFAWEAGRRMAQGGFDIVHGFTQVYPQDVYFLGGGLECYWLKVKYPYPLTRAGMCMIRPIHLAHLYLERQILKPENSRIIMTNSHLCRGQLEEYYRIPPERVRVVPHGVDLSRFNPGLQGRFREDVRRDLGCSPRETVILFVANNFSRKGLGLLIEALARVRDERMRVVVAGRGNPQPFLKTAATLGVADQLTFTGPVHEIEAFYGAADLFALPTLYDPFANVCLEAMACGLPVITTRQNGASEIIKAGETGFILDDPGDVDRLADALRALQDPRVRREMGERAGEVASRHSLQTYTERTLQVYQEVVAAKARGGMFPKGEGRVEVAPEFQRGLKEMGLDRYGAIMGYVGRQVFSDKQSRSVVRVDPTRPGLPVLYLKRHQGGVGWSEVIGDLLCGRIPRSRGWREWENAGRLQALGIPTVTRVAMGERRRFGREQESFFLSAAVDGESLETFLPVRYAPPLTQEVVLEKRRVIRQVADLTRRLHGAGLYHRDYYLGHLFIRPDGQRGWDLCVIDLQRLVPRAFSHLRGQIKDLAALNFTTEGMPISRTDRLRFFKRYRRVSRLDRREKSLIRVILRKTERIGQHTANVLARRTVKVQGSEFRVHGPENSDP